MRTSRHAEAQSKLCRRSGDPPRLSREGKLELTEALRSSTAAEAIPEGFRSDESGRVAPRGEEAKSSGTLRIEIRQLTGQSVYETTFFAERFAWRYLSIPVAIFRPSAIAQTMSDVLLTISQPRVLLLRAPRLLVPWL